MSEPTCAVTGCPKRPRCRGWCSMHYERWRKTGDTGQIGMVIVRAPEDGSCSIDGCDKPSTQRGWCGTHYARWRKHGDPTVRATREPKQRPACAVDGCDKPARQRGWCGTHYARWRKHGDPGGAGLQIVKSPDGRCTIDGCDEPSRKRGWCGTHYARWRRNGDPLVSCGRDATDDAPRCGVDGCPNPAESGGMCTGHRARVARTGSTGGALRPQGAQTGPCDSFGCTEPAKIRGLCRAHYRREMLSVRRAREGAAGVPLLRGLTWDALYQQGERDCHLCGEPVDPQDYRRVVGRDGRNAMRMGRRYPTLDHVTPLALGGLHVPENVALAHHGCNARKGARVDKVA